jgi:hypothetical protein
VFYLAAVLDDLYDAVSFLWSWRWPETPGEVTAVDIERIQDSDGIETFRLAVAYKFSIGSDGPYTGESFWRLHFPPSGECSPHVTTLESTNKLRCAIDLMIRP